MKTKNSFPILFLMILLATSSCKKNSANPPGGGDTDSTGNSGDFTDIYVAGSMDNGSKRVATYWKNGTAVPLTDQESELHDIIVDNGIVYAVGRINEGNVNYAVYWENGIKHLLSDGMYDASANAIEIAYVVSTGNNPPVKHIYITGYEFTTNNGNTSQAIYWDNGDKHIVSSAPSNALDIKMAGGAPIVCGFKGTTSINNGYASVWNTGNPGISPTFSNSLGSRADALVLNIGTDAIIDMYACGRDILANGHIVPVWWQNSSTPHYFTPGDNIVDYATDIKVLNGIVYACGSGKPASADIYRAKYWKNDGTTVNLSNGTTNTFATGIAVKGNNVVVCGYENQSAAVTIAKYWKNGVAVNLSDGTHTALAWAIYAR